jgi:Family of unknown function (DUF5898)
VSLRGNGKAYLASSATGEMFALKLYLLYLNLSDEEGKKECEEIRRDEADKWKALYLGYQNTVFEIELNGWLGLIMPYVATIPMNKWRGLLPQIRKELERLAALGLAYDELALYWCHIGLLRTHGENNEEKVILVDLESTDSIAPETVEATVNEAVERLERLVEWEQVKPEEFIHR